MKTPTFIFVLIFSFSKIALADEAQLAVAANFSAPMQKIAAAFTDQTGHKLLISYGATGKFYTQIRSDAPFDVLLSADQEYPKKLVQEKLAVGESQFTYAVGKLVLWSPRSQFVDPNGDILKSETFKHLAIANPKLAPYGAAAKEVLEKKDLWKKLEGKLVFGESVTQAYQFASTGNAELGFVAFSQVKGISDAPKGSLWIVPQEIYAPLKQDAILLANGKNSTAAKQFLSFLKEPKAKAIMSKFGYD